MTSPHAYLYAIATTLLVAVGCHDADQDDLRVPDRQELCQQEQSQTAPQDLTTPTGDTFLIDDSERLLQIPSSESEPRAVGLLDCPVVTGQHPVAFGTDDQRGWILFDSLELFSIDLLNADCQPLIAPEDSELETMLTLDHDQDESRVYIEKTGHEILLVGADICTR